MEEVEKYILFVDGLHKKEPNHKTLYKGTLAYETTSQ